MALQDFLNTILVYIALIVLSVSGTLAGLYFVFGDEFVDMLENKKDSVSTTATTATTDTTDTTDTTTTPPLS